MIDKNYKKYILTATGILFLVAVLLYFYFNNPSDQENLYVSCTFKKITGWDCGGCGAQRSLHHLLHFEIYKAFRYNGLFVMTIPYFLVVGYFYLREILIHKKMPKTFWFSGKFALVMVGILLIFMFVRNLPMSPFHYLRTP